MDPISVEKLRAMKMYNKNSGRRQQFLPTLTLYVVAAIVLGLFISSPIWLPRLLSFLNFLFLVSLPDMATALLTPMCLFILCNLIVAFLVGESRLLAPRHSSPVHDIYEEYLGRNSATGTAASGAVVDHKASSDWEEEEEMGVGEEEEEELHRRVEEFISRVKKERRLEGKMTLLCY